MSKGLILVPTLREMTRAQREAHLEQVRAKRMVAAVVYNEGRTAKLDHLSQNLQRRVNSKLALLEKAMDALDKALDRTTRYMDELQILENELDLTSDLKAIMEKPE